VSSLGTEIGALLGPDAVVEGDSEPDHSIDWSPAALLRRRAKKKVPPPSCVVRPKSTEQVSLLLEWARRTTTRIMPVGGRSGVVEGVRGEGAVVVDMQRLDRITSVDDKSRLVTVGAGVTGPALREHLAPEWMLGHEPQSVDISTVGGWVATKACGQLSAKYGGIEDLVAGLVAVLPGGTVVRSKTTPRRSVGPDVAGLMLGSEGTLGIVTVVTLRVSPTPARRVDRCVRFNHMTDGVAACRTIAQSDLSPTVARLYDPEDAALFLRHHPDEPQGPLLILSFDGDGCDSRATRAVELARGTEGNAGLVAHWWEHRNDAVEEFRKLLAGEGLLGQHGIVDTMEVSGTWTALRDLYHSMKSGLGSEADIVGCHLSHIYPDGACLYFTMGSACADDDEAAAKLERWWEVGMRACLDSGGSISHHHGVGRTKVRWLEEELDGWYDVMTAVKRAIDPKRIMNPGALGL
jgi:alkyldihydroxyacetonephosphate synthase